MLTPIAHPTEGPQDSIVSARRAMAGLLLALTQYRREKIAGASEELRRARQVSQDLIRTTPPDIRARLAIKVLDREAEQALAADESARRDAPRTPQ